MWLKVGPGVNNSQAKFFAPIHGGIGYLDLEAFDSTHVEGHGQSWRVHVLNTTKDWDVVVVKHRSKWRAERAQETIRRLMTAEDLGRLSICQNCNRAWITEQDSSGVRRYYCPGCGIRVLTSVRFEQYDVHTLLSQLP